MIKNRIVVREKSTNKNRTFVLFSCLHLYTFKKMSDIIGTVNTVLSVKISFVTFIRNEVKKTSIHHKNELFITNPDTNFWLTMVIVKKFTELFQSHLCD